MLLARVLRWVGIVLLVGAGLAWWLGEKGNRTPVLLLLSIGASGTADFLRRRALPPERPPRWL